METSLVDKQYRRKIFVKALIRFVLAFLSMGVLVFLPAGTFRYWNGWICIGGLMLPMIYAITWLFAKDPQLLEKRINLREKEKEQKWYIKISMIFYLTAYIIPGLDFRFGWSNVPVWLVIISLILMVGGYIMFIIVMMQNRYASRVIELQDEQKVIETGL